MKTFFKLHKKFKLNKKIHKCTDWLQSHGRYSLTLTVNVIKCSKQPLQWRTCGGLCANISDEPDCVLARVWTHASFGWSSFARRSSIAGWHTHPRARFEEWSSGWKLERGRGRRGCCAGPVQRDGRGVSSRCVHAEGYRRKCARVYREWGEHAYVYVYEVCM